MYINYSYAKSKDIQPQDIIVLQTIKQQRSEDLEEVLSGILDDERLGVFEKMGLITQIGGKKGDSELSRLRLSKKGNTILLDIESYGILEEDVTVFEWMKNYYLKAEKEIGSEKKCKELIAWFRSESQISKNELVHLCSRFVGDDSRMEYSKVLQYIFWKPENHFQTKPDLSQSKLWLYYEKYREQLDNEFSQLKDKNNEKQ